MPSLRIQPGWMRPAKKALPPGWRAVQLGAVCQTVAGGRLRLTKESHYQSAGIPAFSAAGQDGFVGRAEFEDTDAVILSSVGANCGRCFLAEGTWTTLANVQAIITAPQISARFLHYRVNRDDYWPRSGSAQPFIKPSDIGRCWVALPPLPEQRRIAEILDTVDEAIRKTEEIIAKLKQVKQGLLHDLLTRGIDENGELRDPDRHPDQFNDSPLGGMPSSWGLARLEQVLESSVDGPFGSNLKTEHYVEQPGVRVVRLQNIGEGEFLDHEKVWVSEAHAQLLARHEVRPGDVLVACLGDPTHMYARACEYPPDHAPGIVKADCFRLRPTDAMSPGFLAHALNCHRWRRDLAGLAHRSGVSRDRINLGKLRQVRVPVPPRAEQRSIARIAEQQSGRIQREVEEVSKLRLLKQGLMEDLLTGRVRVTALLEEAAE